PGLYAVGELGSFFGHIYLLGGNLSEGIVGGRIAGRRAARGLDRAPHPLAEAGGGAGGAAGGSGPTPRSRWVQPRATGPRAAARGGRSRRLACASCRCS